METKTDIELKALAYDHLANIENSQKVIQMINQELVKRNTQPSDIKEEIKEEKKGLVK